MSALDTLRTFDLNSLPDLDTVVLGALELLTEAKLPESNTPFHRPLVIGSGNAAVTGRILFRHNDAVFADETSYKDALARVPDIDGIVLISASGGKHAFLIAKDLESDERPKVLLTNNPTAPAATYFQPDNVLVFPKNREPYTYNTSTYLSMILADTGEQAATVKHWLEEDLAPKLPSNFGAYRAFTFILSPQHAELKEMLRTKFDELFGVKLTGRFFTTEEMKHAKTVVPDDHELFIGLGTTNQTFGRAGDRLNIELPAEADYGTAMAIGYYLVGQIQKAHPAYFKDNIANYAKQAGELFGHSINPIVE